MTAWRVPATTDVGVAKFAVKYPPEPVENPGMVAVARSGPIGAPPLVARMETAKLGVVPVQPLQKRSRSTLVTVPFTAGVNVCPAQLVAFMPKPLFVTTVFC